MSRLEIRGGTGAGTNLKPRSNITRWGKRLGYSVFYLKGLRPGVRRKWSWVCDVRKAFFHASDTLSIRPAYSLHFPKTCELVEVEFSEYFFQPVVWKSGTRLLSQSAVRRVRSSVGMLVLVRVVSGNVEPLSTTTPWEVDASTVAFCALPGAQARRESGLLPAKQS